MLKKLLKYDFNAIFKYWWIGALTTVILAIAGAGCGSILETEKELPGGVTVFATIGIVLVVLGIFAFIIFSELLVYVRFYKHLFTDEGYLTFTLPVKRHQILSSKLISGFICGILTALVAVVDGAIIILTTFRKEFFYDGWYKDLTASLKEFIADFGGVNLIIQSIELILLAFLSLAFSILFTYLCITFAGAISKKSKLASAILIYYGATSISSVFMYMFYFFGVDAVNGWMYDMQRDTEVMVYTLLLLLAIFFITMLCVGAYTLNYRLLDRKLNLN